MKRNLVVTRAGGASLHPHWMAGGPRNFDLALSYYGDEAPEPKGAVLIHRKPGGKWAGLLDFIEQHRSLVEQYAYVWLVDDDVLASPATISEMFDIARDLDSDYGQPALSLDSYAGQAITYQHQRFQIRFTNYAEIMAPFFSSRFLLQHYRKMEGLISGWNLDAVWPRLSELGRVIIIDRTPVRHTRPLFGPSYQHNKRAGVTPQDEAGVLAARHFIEEHFSAYPMAFGGIDLGDRLVGFSEDGAEANLFFGLLRLSTDPLRISEQQRSRLMTRHWRFGSQRMQPYDKGAIKLLLTPYHQRWLSRSAPPKEAAEG